MNSIDALREEHEAIREMLEVLEKMIQKIGSGEAVDPEHLDWALDFIRIFADRCHHGKEEDILFPTMEEHGVPRAGPIGVMLMEHDLGRGYVNKMVEALGEYKAGNTEALKRFIESAEEYVELLRQHIDKENNILFSDSGDAHSQRY